jgi:hypothetical protein
MPRTVRKGLVFGSVLALGLVPRAARAQPTTPTTTPTTTTTTTVATPCTPTVTMPTVGPSDLLAPERFLNFGTPKQQDLGTSTRNPAFSPLGINYQDCVNDMTLEFRLTGCGFTGNTQVLVMASTSSDCTQPSERGNGGQSVCWPVSQGSIPNQLSGSLTYDIPVRNIVGPQALSPSPTTITPQGISACHAQPTYLPVPININFVPVTPGSGALAGQAYQYILQTDMVGPPAPAGVSIGNGDTLFVVNWTPNTDTDTGGYDVVIDPIPGQEGDAALAAAMGGVPPVTQLVCPAEGGMSTAVSDASSEESSVSDASEEGDVAAAPNGVADGAPTDATMSDATASDASGAAASLDGGCYTKTVGGSGLTNSDAGACADPLLTTGVVLTDGGTVVATPEPTEAFDDAGNIIETDAGSVESTIGGGIWNPPAGHVVNADPTLGVTATGKTNATHTVSGLTNGVPYHVVVAAVDNFENVGPPSSPPQCATPAPVNDFWKIYRTDGGQAGGGFCALEAVGSPAASTVAFGGAGALVVAGLRRRRSKRRQ